VRHALELWTTVYEPADIVPTVRQLFYALAVAGVVPKSEKGYDHVQRVLARARERGEYPWEGIHDGLREVHRVSAWDSLPSFYNTVRHAYRLDKWANQPLLVELWLEKDTVRGTVESLAEEYEVPLLVGRGYLSVTAKHDASERIGPRPLVALYVGDHDPSGIDMEEEAEAWVRDAAGQGARLVLDRIAVTLDDHRNPSLPHLPVNGRDARARKYVARCGHEVTEVEALAPEELQERLRRAIERYRDGALWQAAVEREAGERALLRQRLSA
jgi:hypothetical protein